MSTTVTNAAKADEQQPAFPYTPKQLRQIAAAVRDEGYPPQGRNGLGTVVRRRAAVGR
jgi:hypothetical protein